MSFRLLIRFTLQFKFLFWLTLDVMLGAVAGNGEIVEKDVNAIKVDAKEDRFPLF